MVVTVLEDAVLLSPCRWLLFARVERMELEREERKETSRAVSD